MKVVICLLLFVTTTIQGASVPPQRSSNASNLPKLPTAMEEAADNLIDNPLTKQTMFRRFSVYEWTPDIEEHPENHVYWFENLMRHAWDEHDQNTVPYTDTVRVCHTVIAIYLGALQDLRRYYEIRYLYLNNIEYEVGYMVHEIVNKYQRMIELFGIVRKRYVYQITKYKAPSKYMLYMYTIILEVSQVVIHLCNMLHELKFKYPTEKGPGGKAKGGGSVFSDIMSNGTVEIGANPEWEAYIKTYKLKREMERKARLRKLALNRKGVKVELTPWTIMPYRGTFPLHYGWSIEYW